MNRSAVDLDKIVEQIIDNLRPLKLGLDAKAAEALTRSYIRALGWTPRFNSDIAPGAALNAHRNFLKSLKSTIRNYERLPRGTKSDIMHFAPPFRLWPPQQDDPARMGDAVLAYLTRLAELVASPMFTAKDGAAVKHQLTRTKAIRTAAAGYAFKLMREVSRRCPAGTDDGAYQTIASLMYEAVSGESAKMKDWCKKELRRQRDHEAILREMKLYDVYRNKKNPDERMATLVGAGLPNHIDPRKWELIGKSEFHEDEKMAKDVREKGFSRSLPARPPLPSFAATNSA